MSASDLSPALPAKRLARALRNLAVGVPNPWDESTDYFSGFYAELPTPGPVDDATLRSVLKVSPRYRLDRSEGDLSWMIAESDGDLALGYRMVAATLAANLVDVERVVARAPGVVRVRVWLVGRFDNRYLVGLRSTSTET